MKYGPHGDNTSQVEVTNISTHGIWVLVNSNEMFLPFKDFPWFQEAPIKKILHVEMPSENHLYWPDLDIDLDIQSILSPVDFPLISTQSPR
jgi:hypothetical protein